MASEKWTEYTVLCRQSDRISPRAIEVAVRQGYRLADETSRRFPGLSVRETAEASGIGIRYKDGGLCAGKLICGAYSPRGRFIELYRDGLDRLDAIKGELPGGPVDTEAVVIAHELYHALSCDRSVLPEAVAAAFATRLCRLPFEAPLLDRLLKQSGEITATAGEISLPDVERG